MIGRQLEKKMEKRQMLILGVLLGSTFHASAQICPNKVSDRLCPAYSNGVDSTSLKVRIMLDPELWSPSKTGENNPLVDAAKDMFNKYEFKTIERPDSAYRPLFLNGGSPSVLEAIYHNVIMSKNQIDSVAKESYVKTVQLGCNRTISTGLCDTFNMSLDTAWVKLFINFKKNVENDTVAMTDYLSEYDTRNPEKTEEKITPESIVKYPIRGVAISRMEFEKMSFDPEVLQLTEWYKVSTRIYYQKTRINSKVISNQSFYSVDGKQLKSRSKLNQYRILRNK